MRELNIRDIYEKGTGKCPFSDDTVASHTDEYVQWLEDCLVKSDFIHSVSDIVQYDNLGEEFKPCDEEYIIFEKVENGYIIGNCKTSGFFAYDYQIRTSR